VGAPANWQQLLDEPGAIAYTRVVLSLTIMVQRYAF
jgi:hypothetical protein